MSFFTTPPRRQSNGNSQRGSAFLLRPTLTRNQTFPSDGAPARGGLPEAARGSLPTGKDAAKLKESAEKAHASRLRKDQSRKARLKAEGKSAYQRQT